MCENRIDIDRCGTDKDAEIFTRGDQDGQDWKWADQRDS